MQSKKVRTLTEYSHDWRHAHKVRARYLSYRGTTRTFMRHYATKVDLRTIIKMAKSRLTK